MSDDELEPILAQLRDENLKLTLPFGIGLHHAGLIDGDRRVVEELFVNRKIQVRTQACNCANRWRATRERLVTATPLNVADRNNVGDWQVLVATSTLAWGVNSPTHLVIIKGTEFFDAKQHRYVDMPVTDVLQMMGRAGRPQFDDSGKAVIFVHDIKKDFYKKFLYEPFPVESSLHTQLTDHLNAEVIVASPSTGGSPGKALIMSGGVGSCALVPRFRSLRAPSNRSRTALSTCIGRTTTAAS